MHKPQCILQSNIFQFESFIQSLYARHYIMLAIHTCRFIVLYIRQLYPARQAQRTVSYAFLCIFEKLNMKIFHFILIKRVSSTHYVYKWHKSSPPKKFSKIHFHCKGTSTSQGFRKADMSFYRIRKNVDTEERKTSERWFSKKKKTELIRNDRLPKRN